MSQALLKRYGWSLLTLILFIIFLMCGWSDISTNGDGSINGGVTTSTEEPDGETTIGDPLVPDWGSCDYFSLDDTVLNDGDIYTRVITPVGCPVGELKIEFERFHEAIAYTGNAVWTITDCNGNVFNFQDNANVNTFAQYGGTPDENANCYWDGTNQWTLTLINNCGNPLTFAYEVTVLVYHDDSS